MRMRGSHLGLSVPQVNLSTRPEKSVGTDAIWSLAEGALQQALQQKGWAFQVRAGAPAATPA